MYINVICQKAAIFFRLQCIDVNERTHDVIIRHSHVEMTLQGRFYDDSITPWVHWFTIWYIFSQPSCAPTHLSTVRVAPLVNRLARTSAPTQNSSAKRPNAWRDASVPQERLRKVTHNKTPSQSRRTYLTAGICDNRQAGTVMQSRKHRAL